MKHFLWFSRVLQTTMKHKKVSIFVVMKRVEDIFCFWKSTCVIIVFLSVSCGRQEVSSDQTSTGILIEENDSLAAIQAHYKEKLSAKEFAFEANDPSRDDWQKPDSVLALLGDVSDKTILDLGAGTGYFTFKLAEKGANVIAADVVENYLNFINAETTKQLDDFIETRLVPYDSPLLEKEEVDIVLLVNTYYQISDRKSYFKQVFEGMKKGGVLCVVDTKLESCLEENPEAIDRVPYIQVIKELNECGFVSEQINLQLLDCQYVILMKKP